MVFIRITRLSRARNRRAARVGQAENFGHLVKSFADNVILSLSQQLIVAVAAKKYKLRMSARDNQGQKGKARLRFWLGKLNRPRRLLSNKIDVDMSLDVMHRVERFTMQNRQRSRRQ